ncbi:hypothetical protein GN156_00160 [bacterium LRH843]|nr:hypothetical protein [bacterium LRH843]
MAKKNSKTKLKKSASEKYAYTMKMVTSGTCLACKTPCTRGLTYAEKMQVPGAIGNGVPCILTKGKGFK